MRSVRYFICVSILFFSLFNQIIANETISGIVFNDLNKNSRMDKGEKGIADVIVSNQRDVVVTSENGGFTLPLIDGQAIFITKPAGYEFPLTKYNIPQFSYTYNKQGSPSGLKYEGLRPNSEVPDPLYFPLYKDEYRESFKVLITGDPQQRDSTEVNYFRDDVVADMFGKDARFYMALGDIAADNLSIYQHYNDVVAQLDVPVYNVPGNHDENYQVKDDTHSLDTFKRIYGPEYYSFNYGKVHFIVLDIVEYTGWDSTSNRHGPYRGYLHDDQLTWLKNDLIHVPDDHLIVLTMHIPFYTEYSKSEDVNLVNREELFKILESRKHLLALSGHLHIIENLKLNQTSGWNSTTPLYSMNVGAGCGAWWSGPKDERGIPLSYCMDGAPNGYYIISFEGNSFNHHFYPASQCADFQMRISYPNEPVPVDSLPKTQIVVNVFNADSETEVYCQIDDSDRILMMRKRMKDPFMISYFKNNREDFPSWVTDVAETDHIWVSDLPENLDIGQHSVKVSAIDGLNNIYSEVKIFEVRK
jgi:hypothetical protein